jgi:hypothetical protein
VIWSDAPVMLAILQEAPGVEKIYFSFVRRASLLDNNMVTHGFDQFN